MRILCCFPDRFFLQEDSHKFIAYVKKVQKNQLLIYPKPSDDMLVLVIYTNISAIKHQRL